MSDPIRIPIAITPLDSPISKSQSNPESGRNLQDRRLAKRKAKMAAELHGSSQNKFADPWESEDHQLDVLI